MDSGGRNPAEGRDSMSEKVILGYTPEPKYFKYKEVMEHGKPQHEPFDAFRLKHPSMPLQKRAKIFAPFDALRGFNFKIREAQTSAEQDYDI